MAQIVIFASFMVAILFVPAAYSFPKNLLDQLYLYEKDFERKTRGEDKTSKKNKKYDSDILKRKVIYFFYASDLTIFSGGIFAFFAFIIAIGILFKFNRWWTGGCLFCNLVIMIFYICHYWELRIDEGRSEPEWNDTWKYMVLFISLYALYFFLSFAFVLLDKKLEYLIFLILIVLGIHVTMWFIPAIHYYAPLTSLQKLRKILENEI